MNKLFRWYNQNRILVIIILIIVVFFFMVIWTYNDILETQIEENLAIQANNVENTITTTTTASEANVSMISGETISEDLSKINTDTIEQFVQYCNDGEIENAYNMLSSECKEVLYTSVENFERMYYDNIFYKERAYSLENWYSFSSSSTYYIYYTDDILSAGTTDSEDNVGDYITVVKKDDGYYINLSSYVGRQEVNKSVTSEGVTITVNWLDRYMNNTVANVTVQNGTDKRICLDTKEDALTTFMYDENELEYLSFLTEIASAQLNVYQNASITLNIKFNKMYNPERTVAGIYFGDIVLNYDEYISDTTGTVSKEKIKINVEF